MTWSIAAGQSEGLVDRQMGEYRMPGRPTGVRSARGQPMETAEAAGVGRSLRWVAAGAEISKWAAPARPECQAVLGREQAAQGTNR